MSSKPDFEFSHVKEVPIEFYEPFRRAADEEDLASRVRKLQQRRSETTMAIARYEREAAEWASRAQRAKKQLEHFTDQLKELGAL